MIFTVYGEPVGKGRPRFTKGGHAYTPQKTADYENLVRWAYVNQGRGKRIDEGPVRIEIKAYYGIAKSDSKRVRLGKLSGALRPTKKPDCDNVLKAIADALNGIAYKDDVQVVEASVEKYYAENPRVEVSIEEVRNENYQPIV